MNTVQLNHAQKLGWIRRRARRLQRFYCIKRHLAVELAGADWLDFAGGTS
jgi:hypothetical protein